MDDSLKHFNDRMINEINITLSTLNRLPQYSFDILSYKINNPEPMSGLGYSVSLKSENHEIIKLDITNVNTDEINQIEQELGTTNHVKNQTNAFSLDNTLQMKLSIEDNISIPLEDLLESCEMIAKTNMIPYIKIIDHSKLNYCEGVVIMDYSLLHILTYGESWYSQHGYISVDHTKETAANKRTIDNKMGYLLEQLYGSSYISGMVDTFSKHIHNIDNATFSMDMKVSAFFKQILDYFHSLLKDPNKIIKLCNSDKSVDYSEYSKSIITVFNEINHICNRLNEKMTNGDSNFDLLSYNRVLYKKVSDENINNESMDESADESMGEPVQQRMNEPVQEQMITPVQEQMNKPVQEQMNTPVQEQMDESVDESMDESVDESEDNTIDQNSVESNKEIKKETVSPVKEDTKSESKPTDKPDYKKGLYMPGGSAHPNVDLIRLPFNGGGKTLKRKHRNKTHRKIKKNKNHSKNSKYKNNTKKWSLLNILS